MNFTVKAIAEILKGVVEGDGSIEVNNISTIEHGKPNTLSFLSNPKYEEYLYTTEASAVLVSKELQLKKEVQTSLIRVENPYESFAKLLKMVEEYVKPQKEGIEEPSYISTSAKVGEKPYFGAFAYIGDNVQIGDNCKIYPHVYIGDNVQIGDNTTIYSGAKIYYNTEIGKNCTIQAGAILGSDGFGFAPDKEGKFQTIPQLGNVILEDNVDIGANVCIDRATVESTIVREGAKIDNLVQIAHNVEVGENTAMAAQVGIAGSVKIGKNNLFGGQAGMAGHLTVGDNNQIGAKSGIFRNIGNKEKILGSPAQSSYRTMKHLAILRVLEEKFAKLRKL